MTAQEYPASEVPTSHLGIIYFGFVTPSLLETVSRWKDCQSSKVQKNRRDIAID